MKQIRFYLDFISPYAYLAFEKLPQALGGISHSVSYQPILFAGLLARHGQLGPAEIAPKRDWTYRQCLWLAREQGTQLDLPSQHPFNPLGLLRLAVACSPDGQPNRYICEQVFRHTWHGGADAADATRLAVLTQQLQPARDPQSQGVKDQLKAATDDAVQLGLFGVPSMVVDGRVFWGQDALPMLRAYCLGDAWFAPDGPWDSATGVSAGITRPR